MVTWTLEGICDNINEAASENGPKATLHETFVLVEVEEFLPTTYVYIQIIRSRTVYSVMSDGPQNGGAFTTTYEWPATIEGELYPRERLFIALQEHSNRYRLECLEALRPILLKWPQ